MAILKLFSLSEGAPSLSSLEKDKDIDFDLLQDLMDVDIDPLDIDLEKDPLAAKVFKVRNLHVSTACFLFHSHLSLYLMLSCILY